MELKLKKDIVYFYKGHDEVFKTLTFDTEKCDVAKVQRDLAFYFNRIATNMVKDLKNTIENNVNQDSVEEKEPTQKDYMVNGLNLYAYLDQDMDLKIIKIMFNHGVIFYQNEKDLANNDGVLEKLDIIDIYTILGYYFINFTLKQFQ